MLCWQQNRTSCFGELHQRKLKHALKYFGDGNFPNDENN